MTIEGDSSRLPRNPKDAGRVESAYNSRIDRQKSPEYAREIAEAAERTVISFFNTYFGENILVRPATPFEDSGVAHNSRNLIPETGYQIDAVAYGDFGPAMCMQITTTENRRVFEEKMVQISKEPTVRLEGMRTADVPIPKILIRLDPKSVASFLKDRNFDRHRDLVEKILHDTVVSLKYDLIRVRTSKEKEKIQKLLDIFESKAGGTLQ